MLAAPQGAIYITFGHSSYYRALAHELGRMDLTLVPHTRAREQDAYRYVGRTLSGIVVDHAVSEVVSPIVFDEVQRFVNRLTPYIRAAPLLG